MRQLLKRIAIIAGILLGTLVPLVVKTGFRMPSASMAPTLVPHDRMLVWRHWPWQAIAKVGDVIAFYAPPSVGNNAGEPWIKRVLAVEGQRVRRNGETFIVDDKTLALGPTHDDSYLDVDLDTEAEHRVDVSARIEAIGDTAHFVFTDRPPLTDSWPSLGDPRANAKGLACDGEACTVEPGYVFVVGDNRDHSSDSRIWGAVPTQNVIGRISFVWFPHPHVIH